MKSLQVASVLALMVNPDTSLAEASESPFIPKNCSLTEKWQGIDPLDCYGPHRTEFLERIGSVSGLLKNLGAVSSRCELVVSGVNYKVRLNLVPTKFPEAGGTQDLNVQLESTARNPLGLATLGYYDVGADGVPEIRYNPSTFLDAMDRRHADKEARSQEVYQQIIKACNLDVPN
jgi:hypothetical protein